MERSRVRELHFICPFENAPSVLERGILCKSRALRLDPPPTSVADTEVQALRAAVTIPGGGPLHSRVNLYFDARNAMMSRLRHLNDTLAVLGVSGDVLDLPDVIVTDRNAASGDATFRPAAEGIAALSEDEVYAEWWIQSRDAKQKRQAEVLVPRRVPPEYITGAYVRSVECAAGLADVCAGTALTITVRPHLYFGT
jgi:ssDNA thymidine ADP-ribosyltransferase DarT-like protein